MASAKKRRIEFKLNKEEFVEWYSKTAKTCSYCDLPEENYVNLRLSRYNTTRLTLDRIDNKKGYEIGKICL